MSENKLSSKAYIILEEFIVTLRLEPAKIYLEKELMSLTNISRTPLREALLKLSHQSLINIIPRRGIEISDINMINQLAILETRRVLDSLLISRASKYATNFEKDKLLKFKILMQEAVKNKDIKEFLRIDKQLDQKIFETARNDFAAQATSPLHIRSRRFWYYFKGIDDLEHSAKIHMDLIDSIVSSDEKLAVKISNDMIDSLVEIVKKYINI